MGNINLKRKYILKIGYYFKKISREKIGRCQIKFVLAFTLSPVGNFGFEKTNMLRFGAGVDYSYISLGGDGP